MSMLDYRSGDTWAGAESPPVGSPLPSADYSSKETLITFWDFCGHLLGPSQLGSNNSGCRMKTMFAAFILHITER